MFIMRLGVPEQALGGIPIGFADDKLSELSCLSIMLSGIMQLDAHFFLSIVDDIDASSCMCRGVDV